MKTKRKNKYAKNRARLQPAKDFDKAIVGKMPNGYLIYDHWALVDILVKTNRCSEDEALDWISYNISCLPLALAYWQ